jgi:hypothetical protein
MVAAAFKAVLVWKTAEGYAFTQRCTVSDVNGEYYVFQDGSTDITLPSDTSAVYLTDIQLSAAGTDTSYAIIYANQRETGEQIQNALCLASNLARQFRDAPPGFKPGTRVKIKQVT